MILKNVLSGTATVSQRTARQKTLRDTQRKTHPI